MDMKNTSKDLSNLNNTMYDRVVIVCWYVSLEQNKNVFKKIAI